jgi:hypothetical protein
MQWRCLMAIFLALLSLVTSETVGSLDSMPLPCRERSYRDTVASRNIASLLFPTTKIERRWPYRIIYRFDPGASRFLRVIIPARQHAAVDHHNLVFVYCLEVLAEPRAETGLFNRCQPYPRQPGSSAVPPKAAASWGVTVVVRLRTREKEMVHNILA